MDTDFTCEPSQFSEPSGKGLGQRIHAYFAELGGLELELPERDGSVVVTPLQKFNTSALNQIHAAMFLRDAA